MFYIQDWAGNMIAFDIDMDEWETFDEAEEALSDFLGDDYDDCRGLYEIIEV